MESAVNTAKLREVPVLLRGEPEPLQQWIEQGTAPRVLFSVAIIVAGAGLFGAAMGCWRAPLQAVYTAVKFPLVILLVTLGNGLLNGMLAPLLGLDLRFRQSLLAVLMSFTIAAVILGAFSPLVFFLIWNAPPMASRAVDSGYRFVLLAQVVIIAFAGVAANVRLVQLLQRLSGSARIARNVLLAWLAGNLFLGTQLCWILRPFIGSPGLPVQFLRADAFRGSFYEAVFWAARRLLLPD